RRRGKSSVLTRVPLQRPEGCRASLPAALQAAPSNNVEKRTSMTVVTLTLPVALALFEVLQELTDALWQQYETDLVELVMKERGQFPASQQVLDLNNDSPF
ncbi:MAG: hypothetical protein U9R74_09285, partial [Pseudomonadota bacterium]|nr:hypothetical protein [Pseudomonadota bacterium]